MKSSTDIFSSIDRWASSADADRLDSVRAVAAWLGDPYAAGDGLVGEMRVGEIVHRPTGYSFVLVPGGTFTMGLTEEGEDDLARVLAAPDGVTPPGAALEEWCLGVRENYGNYMERAKPPLRIDQPPILFGRVHLAHGAEFEPGWRLPRDGEWEYVARETGRRSWLSAPPFADMDAVLEATVASENALGVRDLLSEGGELMENTRGRGAGPSKSRERRGGSLWGWQDDTFATYVLHVTFSEPLDGDGGRRAVVALANR